MRRYLLVGIINFLVLLDIAARPVMLQQPSIMIQPLGSLCTEDGALIKEALEQFYSLPVRILPPIELPQGVYYRPGPRYRADKLIEFCNKARVPKEADHGGLTTAKS